MMKARCSFVFRQFKHRDAGKFIKEGKEIPYKEAYILRCDDVTEDGEVDELEFTIPVNETAIINKLQKYKYMDEIVLELNIQMAKDKRTGYVKLIDVITEDKDIADSNRNLKPEQKKLF